jgi:UDP-2,3-diacylglucosamine hydrolase
VTAWFASDLHLDPSTPEIAERFQRFLAGPVQGARALFLLGDLFEAWLGDDDPEPVHRAAIASVARVAGSGTLVYVMRGNRDFMLGERFCRDAGAILLDDPAILEVGGTRLVLSHGDGLCVDDRAYQRLRALVRDPGLRAGFERLPIEARRRLALEARAGSREHLANASSYITDVNAGALESVFRDSGAGLMIHGHTHRPGIHRTDVDGLPRTRIVLGAWHDAADVVRWDDRGWELIPCPA